MVVRHVSSEAEFVAETRQKNKLVVVDFFATWCGPCKAIEEPLEALSSKYSKATFLKVDVDKLQSVATSCGVRAMPTLQLYKDSLMVREIVGPDVKGLESAILAHYQVFDSFSGKGQALGGAPASSSLRSFGKESEAAACATGSHGSSPSALSTISCTVGSILGGVYSIGSGVVSSVAHTLVSSGTATPMTSTCPPSSSEPEEPKDGDCEMQFRMPDGAVLRRKFYSSDKIENAKVFIEGRLPPGYNFRLMTNYPRKFYEGVELQKSLKEEKLSPRGQFIVSPANT